MLTTMVRTCTALLTHAREIGVDTADLQRQVGLTDDSLADADARLPEPVFESLWRALIARRELTDLGVQLGARIAARELGIVGYTVTYSATLLDALRRVERYTRIINEAVDVSVKVEGQVAEVSLGSQMKIDKLRHPVDFRMTALVAVLRELTAVEFRPLEVRFPYGRPADTSALAGFFDCPLSFGHVQAAIALGEAEQRLPIRFADEDLCGYLDRLAEEALEEMDRSTTFADQVKRVIWNRLSQGNPGLEGVAEALGVSGRTLQRRLKDEKTTYARELETLRREMSTLLLRSGDLAVYEVAYLLGYAEPSTFHRAFRRWTGKSPRTFRESTT